MEYGNELIPATLFKCDFPRWRLRLPLAPSDWLSLRSYGRGVRRDDCLRCRLWIMTVNALRPSAKLLRQQTYTQNDLMVDPLIVLRCDQRVYR